MVAVEGSMFKMGCTIEQSDCNADEKPVHTVILSDFYISKYEVTHEQYIIFLNEKGVSSDGSYGGKEYVDMDYSGTAVGHNGNRFYFKGSQYADDKKCPMINVTWYGAKAFADWLSSKTGKKYKLPTEAEWEYAARGGKESRGYLYAGSNNIDVVAEYYGNNNSKTKPVGGKEPNELGLYDMSGNVWEWCADYCNYVSGVITDTYYDGAKDPLCKIGSNRVVRGGSWRYSAKNCRVAIRFGIFPDNSNYYRGFRLSRTK